MKRSLAKAVGGVSQFVLFIEYYCDKVKEVNMGGAFSMRGKNNKCLRHFSCKT
jgi:hypothetical protein